LACPYFLPTKKLEGGEWPHPARLPLGAGWQGLCTASATQATPTAEELRDHCNLGYARCQRVPAQRSADAVRFSVAAANEARVVLNYVCECNHHPGEHGTLEFVVSAGQWTAKHADARVQRMAECYLESHMERTRSKQW
jgi:hypothetical protein